jgi:hypothetical protein
METKYIDESVKSRIDKFCLGSAIKIGGRDFVPLFHYTGGSSLISIVNSGSLWTTQVSCMNDSKETTYAVELLRDEIAKELKENRSEEEQIILKLLQSELLDITPHSAGTFVACFSARRDDLSQWRGYGRGESSYAIEFDPAELIKGVESRKGMLVPCLYKKDEQEDLIKSALTEIKTIFTDNYGTQPEAKRSAWAEEYTKIFLWNLSFLAPFIKHHSFKDEEEWRLIFWLQPQDVGALQFMDRQSMISRHLPITFPKLPIKSVMVGPSRHKEISKVGVGDLLASKGYQPNVEVTEIPFRTI